MEQNILEQHITSILGIDALSAQEQAVFLSEVGDAIFQTSLVQLAATLSDDDQASFESYLATEPEPDVLLEYVVSQYPEFESILQSVVYAYKEEAAKALHEMSDDIKVIDA